jgi:hypothetical protein
MIKAMIDIETMSTRNDAAVIAIGTAIFDSEGIIDKQELLLDPRFVPGHRDEDTLDWWEKQDPEVKERMFSGELRAPEACKELFHFLRGYQCKETWANSPSFDLVILRELFKEASILSFPVHYSRERDYRTLTRLADRLGIDCGEPYTRAEHQAHSALSDAITQAEVVNIILPQLSIKK